MIFLIKRSIKHFYQRLFLGFDDSETWSLDCTIAKFIYPRLIRLKQVSCATPGNVNSNEEWNEILDDMIYAFKTISEDVFYQSNKHQVERVDKGLDLFRKYYFNLWW